MSTAPLKVLVGRAPTVNCDEYPGLGDTWVQLRNAENNDEVIARIYGSGVNGTVGRAKAFADAVNSIESTRKLAELRLEGIRSLEGHLADSRALAQELGAMIHNARRALAGLHHDFDGRKELIDRFDAALSKLPKAGE